VNIEAATAFLAAPAGLALKAMLLWAFLDFATGTFAAVKDGTFALDVIGAFIRKHIFGRVAPIGLLLIAAHFTGDVALAGGALASAAAYTLETAASVKGNFFPPKDSEVVEESVAVNPVPTD
jgi:hypothetical protein